MKRSPMPQRRKRPRRKPPSVCRRQRCRARAWVDGLCKTHARRDADAIFGAEVRAALRCKARTDGWVGSEFDCSGPLQCCHLVPRGYRNVRWDAGNAVAMCAAHHSYFDKHPVEREQTILVWLGEEGWRALKNRALDQTMDWRDCLVATLERRRENEPEKTNR